MMISLPPAKLAQPRELLARWSIDRRVALESELRSLKGRLLHVCEVMRPGEQPVRRIYIQLGLCPYRLGPSNPEVRERGVVHEFTSRASSTTICHSGV